MKSEIPLEIEKLTRYFGNFPAVDNLCMTVPEGAVYGFLGGNGAGKTTTLKMIMGFLHPSNGQIRVLGRPASLRYPSFKQRIGYVSETQMYPQWMKVGKLIKFHSKFYPKWDETLAQRLILDFYLNPEQRVLSLSKGQKRQLALVLALSQGSEFLILDEPFSGLDVERRQQALDLMIEFLGGENRTILISSHILSDLERIVSNIGIISRGRMLIESDYEKLQLTTKRIWFYSDADLSRAREVPGIEVHNISGNKYFSVTNYSDSLRKGIAKHFSQEPEVEDLSLEEIFLEFVRAKKQLVMS